MDLERIAFLPITVFDRSVDVNKFGCATPKD